jgi:hypothetical protein
VGRPLPRHPLVLEINTRVWLHELSARAGRAVGLGDVPPAALESLAARGYDAVWLMGVWTTGPASVAEARRDAALWDAYRAALPDVTVDDVVGSPYAVSRYEVAAGLGGGGGLAAFRARLDHLGIRLLLDFVPNHTARDHWLLAEQPEAFVRGRRQDLAATPSAWFETPAGEVVACGRDPHFPPWTDTAQVDHGVEEGRQAMRRELLAVADQCDGVRCDMAMLLLPDVFARTWPGRAHDGVSFWPEAIGAVRRRQPGFLFVAEAYWGLEPRLHAEGFDCTYDKAWYDRLREGDARGAAAALAGGAEGPCRLRFVENHDEPRAAAVFGPRLPAALAATLLSPGLRLVHEGQIEGRRLRVPVQLRRRADEAPDPLALAAHEAVLAVLREPAVRDGVFDAWEAVSAGGDDRSHESLVAFSWRQAGAAAPAGGGGGEQGGAGACARLALPVPSGPWRLHDAADGAVYERDGDEMRSPGLFVALRPGQAHLFELRPGR